MHNIICIVFYACYSMHILSTSEYFYGLKYTWVNLGWIHNTSMLRTHLYLTNRYKASKLCRYKYSYKYILDFFCFCKSSLHKSACCTLYRLYSLTNCASHAFVGVNQNVECANYEVIMMIDYHIWCLFYDTSKKCNPNGTQTGIIMIESMIL